MADLRSTRAPWRRGAVTSLVLFAALCGVLAALGGGRSVMVLATSLRGDILGAMLALSLANYACRSLRWHVMSRSLGLRTSLRDNILYFLAGFALTATPGKLGESVRLLLLRRHYGYRLSRLAPLAVLDRLADLVALLLGALFGLANARMHPLALALVTVPALLLILTLIRPVLALGSLGLAFRVLRRGHRFFAAMRRAVRLSARVVTGPRVLWLLGMSLLGWSAEALALALLSRAMGVDLSLGDAIGVFCSAMVIGGVSMTPGGIGTTEVALVALLSERGVPLAPAVAITAIIRLTTLWFAVLTGIPFLAIAARRPAQTEAARLAAA